MFPLSLVRGPRSLALVMLLVASGLARADSVVVFNEINYHPWDPAGAEWVELHNQMAVDVDLSAWRLRGGVDFDFPTGTVIAAGGYLLVAGDPVAVGRRALGPWIGNLSNNGERLRLRNNSGRLMDEVEYGDRGRWPIGPDGSGVTLAKRDSDTASGDPANWFSSAEIGGTPGGENFPDAASPPAPAVIVPIDATWRYNESGADLGAGWAETAHAVGAGGWLSGPALLGFETTPAVLPEPLQTTFADPFGNAIITYYFELDFELSAAEVANLDRLLVRHVTDDGAVFYLNGVDAGARFHMPEGPVSATTVASPVVRNAEFLGPFELSKEALVPGTNRLSVEVHQEAAQSNDIVFGAELSITQSRAGASAPLVISEISGVGEEVFRIEIANHGDRAVEAGGYVLASRGAVDESYSLPVPTSLAGGDRIVIEEAALGFRPADGDRLFLFSPARRALVHAARADDLPRAWSAEHGKMLVPAAPSFGAPNTFAINDDIVINEIMYHFREDPGTQGSEAIVETVELIGIGAEWRYNESGVQLAAGWSSSVHPADGVDWRTGPSPLGFELGALPVPIRTTFASPFENEIVTYYFEREFTVTAAQLAGDFRLQLQHLIDDGAVFYLNGQEVDRFNLPAGPVSGATLADPAVRDAVFTGPLDLPTGSLVAGSNRLSVEVHQDAPDSSDVVFGLVLNGVTEIAAPEVRQPIVERDEEWVELYNRGAEEVDLTGWSIDGGIDFNFPAGTRMPPGGYLLISNDAAALAAKYPGHAEIIVGDFRNRLNNDRDLIRLEDAVENPVDEVHYVEGGRWPSLADGRGSSLELRDPHADNSNPRAWAASDESAKQGWQTITYRDTGGQSYGLTRWNEFRLGMLQAGEVLIDDVSVVRDPGGRNQRLIQNGTFSAGDDKWRIIGNHRHSEVIPEPGNPDNEVLHLIAKGATDTRHNHIETTTVGNAAINAGDTYEVSFRARWLSGSNQLNSRCYYQRLARTTQLERPENCGTPGEANSRLIDNLGPTISELRHDPPVPEPNGPITVTANVTDPDGLGELTLKSRADEGPVRSHDFVVDANGRGQGTLPGAAAGTVIQFWIEASDTLGATSFAPARGRDSRALIQVEDGQGSRLRLQEMRVIMLDSDRSFLLQNLNLMSNERLGGTAIYNGRTITYDVAIRLRGSGAGRARDGSNYQSFSVGFPADQLFRGVHGSVGADRSARSPVLRRPDEIYVKHMFNHAGVPCMYDDLVHMIGPSPTYTGIAMLQMARYGSVFASSQFENGGNGSVFNLDITYDPVSSIGGVEGFKPPVPFQHIGTDIRDLGDSEEDYRAVYEIRTGRRRDDYSGLIRFCQTMSAPQAEFDAEIGNVMDVDEWMRYTALTLLCGIGDTFVTGGLQHNIRIYVPEDGQGVTALPWDSDFVFSAGTSSPVLPGVASLAKVAALPRYRRLYWGHLHDLVNRTFNADYMADWLDHYGRVMGANLSGQTSYLRSRGNFALSQLPAEVPFSITTNGGGDFSVDGAQASLQGKGWVNVREFRLAGRADPLPVSWPRIDIWSLDIPLLPGENPIELEVYDFAGERIHTASLVITSTVTEPQPVEFLRITELHYNPDGDEGTEFVELKNIGGLPLDIGGVMFTDGISFTVPDGLLLDPGGFALVVRERAAFEAAYGAGLPVLGEYAPDNLSNGGERVELRDAVGNIIHDFAYSDAWYPATDGGGFSLVVRDDTAPVADWNIAAGWEASRDRGGNPGADNASTSVQFGDYQREYFTEGELAEPAVSGPLGDANQDGTVNLLHYVAGVSPWMPIRSEFLPAFERVGDRLHLRVRRVKSAGDVQVSAEFGDDLASWTEVAEPLGVPIDHGDGTETLVFEDDGPVAAERFGRMRVTLGAP